MKGDHLNDYQGPLPSSFKPLQQPPSLSIVLCAGNFNSSTSSRDSKAEIYLDMFKEFLGQILHVNLSSMLMVLAAAGARGKGAALDEKLRFINNHEHDLL